MISTSAQDIRELVNKIDAIKTEIGNEIQRLPDNPDITLLGKNCFTISTSKMAMDLSLSPETYDFRMQYKALAELVGRCLPENVMTVLNQTLNAGRIGMIRLHPQVIAHVRGIM